MICSLLVVCGSVYIRCEITSDIKHYVTLQEILNNVVETYMVHVCWVLGAESHKWWTAPAATTVVY